MKLRNNSAAMLTLKELDRNTKKQKSSLKKLSSGEKIDMAEAASGYAISERMRAQMRALTQDIQNTQNSRNMLRVAEGAVASTMEILRTLKEKAINSANDTNTDLDRATIQKEVEQMVDQVDLNSCITYNGKFLLNGSTMDDNPTVQEHIVRALHTEWIENTLDLIEDSFGISFKDNEAACKDISLIFTDNAGVGGAGTLAAVAYNQIPGQKTDRMELRINMDEFSTLSTKDMSNVNGQNPSGTGVLDRTIAHELVHAIMASSIADFGSLPGAITEGIAEVVHGIDDLRLTQGLQNAKSTVASMTLQDFTNPGTGDIKYYVGGYIALRYMAAQGGNGQNVMKTFMQTLVQTGGTTAGLDGAVSAATHGKFGSWSDLTTKLKNDASASATDDEFLKKYCDIDLHNKDTGAITGKDAGATSVERTKDTVVPEAGSTKFWYSPSSSTSVINGLTVYWNEDWMSNSGNLTLQVGTKAGQAIRFGFQNMSAEAMGLKNAKGDIISLATRDDANMAIRVLDQAVQRALDVQTTIGSLQSRLEMTELNLRVSCDNVQHSESVIRDTDMAKEMTEFAKNNVLAQAAQSMLSQANQNSSLVLSLLQ